MFLHPKINKKIKKGLQNYINIRIFKANMLIFSFLSILVSIKVRLMKFNDIFLLKINELFRIFLNFS